MLSRSAQTTVTFARPFSLPGLDRAHPPGTYAVEIEEELIQGLSFDAYRRTATSLFLPAIGTGAAAPEMVNVDADDLQAALVADAVAADNGAIAAQDGRPAVNGDAPVPKPRTGKSVARSGHGGLSPRNRLLRGLGSWSATFPHFPVLAGEVPVRPPSGTPAGPAIAARATRARFAGWIVPPVVLPLIFGVILAAFLLYRG